MLARENKRLQLVNKYRQKRLAIKSEMRSAKDYETMAAAQKKLAKLPLNSNPVRHCTRCNQCGRAHAVYRKFGLCRICLRQQLMMGNVTGGRKSSW